MVEQYQETFEKQSDQEENIIEESIENYTLKETTTDTKYEINKNINIDLLEDIPNYVGWIELPNTQINYPVVKGDDNDFYLNHGYDLEENIAGSIYMDRRNIGNRFDQHTIIYGHHMNNGSMFTDLNKYLKEDFYYENDTIYYNDLYNSYTYKIISAYYISADSYELTYDIDADVIDDFISRSLYKSNYVYHEADRFITLSTCNYILDNGRMMVHGVLIPNKND
jgi:sortase B